MSRTLTRYGPGRQGTFLSVLRFCGDLSAILPWMRIAPRLLLVLLGLLVPLAAARAEEERPHILERLPADKLAGMGPLLRNTDIALIESNPDGMMRQVTILSWVPASPQVVHDVVADFEHYPSFLRNMTRVAVTHNPDGTVDQEWVIDILVSRFSGHNRHFFRPDGAIDVEAFGPTERNRYRWEFHPAVGGGTVMVMYGFVDVIHSNSIIRSIVARIPQMEHGLGLSAQLVYVRGFHQRALQLAGAAPPSPPPGKTPSLDFLLDRGRVAVIRSLPSGRLEGISILDRVMAPRPKLEGAVLDGGHYASFIDGITQSYETARSDHEVSYRTVFSMPLISWETRWAAQRDGRGAVDILATDGDLKGTYLRWDLTPITMGVTGGPPRTLAVLRARLDLAAASLILRTLFQKEPLFEHGMSVAFALVMMNGARAHAEGRK
ncbi:MAG TPA: SRPBCC family protein [Polyangia bacterium]|nr:SRPBCC family protein [Polyangia bacterium]